MQSPKNMVPGLWAPHPEPKMVDFLKQPSLGLLPQEQPEHWYSLINFAMVGSNSVSICCFRCFMLIAIFDMQSLIFGVFLLLNVSMIET
jgi:hypothetical protein